MQSAIVCSSVHTPISARTQGKGAALLGEESAVPLHRAGMQSNAIWEGPLDTPILQYDSGVIAAKLDRTEKKLVHKVSFHISCGESLTLIGETGSGKTLIAQSIMGVLPGNVKLVSGEIAFCGNTLPKGKKLRPMLGREIVYIPQNGHEFLDPSRSIRRQMFDSIEKLDVRSPQRYAFACEKLAQVGFTQPEVILEQYPFQLSGGMAQRVTIALALCSRAKLLIADEPTNGLDQDSKQLTLSLLNELFPDAAKLIITHDISVAATCDRILVLCGGRMLETGISSEVLTAPYHPYTKALLGALVENGMRETPALRTGTGFCPFYRRCPSAKERCRTEMPPRKNNSREWWCCAE